MVDFNGIVVELGKWIDERRLHHSIGVSRCAVDLAKHYGVDEDKAKLAGLVHDCAKCLSLEKTLELGRNYGFEADEISLRNKALLHAPIGAYLARDLFEIKDPEILEAIACHTTGKEDMDLLDKIIFVADYTEEDRNYPGVEEIRRLAFIDLNESVIRALELSIKNVLERGKLLHPMTIEARNFLIMETREEEMKHSVKSLKKQGGRHA
ncbi:MAG: HD domain-containing protein [Clostridiales bacterium]|jgi:predicted HD superfamily hydrolase involved in NAD metabolism|nr:HD domain-containing protein [Clostridiales bacterium]